MTYIPCIFFSQSTVCGTNMETWKQQIRIFRIFRVCCATGFHVYLKGNFAERSRGQTETLVFFGHWNNTWLGQYGHFKKISKQNLFPESMAVSNCRSLFVGNFSPARGFKRVALNKAFGRFVWVSLAGQKTRPTSVERNPANHLGCRKFLQILK